MKKLLSVKMLRDMKKSAMTYILCVLIVAVGFCGYSVLELSYKNLDESKNTFFEETSFCDGFAEVEEAPLTAASALMQIPGVRLAEGRLVETLRVSGYEENVQLKLTSIQEHGMNVPLLSRGDMPSSKRREIVLGDGIAKERGLNTGDELILNISGRRVSVESSGSGIMPENIYMVKDMGDFFPNPADYDAAFMDYNIMSQLMGKKGVANSFMIDLEPGYTWAQVEDDIKEALAFYGCYRTYESGDQPSVSMLLDELNQLDKMSAVVPFLFLSVAAVILYITLSRLVEQQRSQIGTLLALGLRIRQIQLHYLLYGGVLGLAGGVIGCLAGYVCAGPMADYYRVYFSLPKATAPLSLNYLLMGTALATVFCAGTAWLSAGGIGRLSPASALRPEAPKEARASILEKIPGFSGLFTVTGLMAVRNLSRNRKKTALAIGGIAFAYMITATLVSMNSLFNVFIFDYWEKTQRQDIMVQFNQPVKPEDAFEAVRNPEVSEIEGVIEFAVTLKGPSGKLDCSVQAIDKASKLCRLYDEDGRYIYVEEEGVIISSLMANRLGAQPGDYIDAEVVYPRERTSRLLVTGITAQYLGSTAYMSYKEAGRISEYRDVYTSLLLKAPADTQAAIKEKLKDATGVALVEGRLGRLNKYKEIMGSMSSIMAAMCMLGVLIGFIVVYVSSIISYEELKRELSTLMSLGLNSRQCLEVISVSQYLLAAGGILAGIPMTMWISNMVSKTMSTELYAIPDFVDATSLMAAIGLTFLGVWFASLVMLRKIKKMSPVELLRDRE